MNNFQIISENLNKYLPPEISSIVLNYGFEGQNDTEYFLYYNDYENAIVSALRDNIDITSIVNSCITKNNIDWNYILGKIAESNYRNAKIITDIVRKVNDYSYFMAAMLKQKNIDCFSDLSQHTIPSPEDLELFFKAAGYSGDMNCIDIICNSFDVKQDNKALFRGAITRKIKDLRKYDKKNVEDNILNYIDTHVLTHKQISEIAVNNLDMLKFLGLPYTSENYRDDYHKYFVYVNHGYKSDLKELKRMNFKNFSERDMEAFVEGAIISNNYEKVKYLLENSPIFEGQFFDNLLYCENTIRIPILLLDYMTEENQGNYDEHKNFLGYDPEIYFNLADVESRIHKMYKKAKKYDNYGLIAYMNSKGLDVVRKDGDIPRGAVRKM